MYILGAGLRSDAHAPQSALRFGAPPSSQTALFCGGTGLFGAAGH